MRFADSVRRHFGIFGSEAADKIAQSSMIVIDGTFIAMLISVLFVVLGAVILIKIVKHR